MSHQPLSAFDFISRLDSRYYGTDERLFRDLHPLLSEEATIRYQLKVEQAIIAELEDSGVAPKGIAQAVARAVREVTAAEAYAEEEHTHHNIRALVNCIRKRLPDEYRGFVHLFATSNDIIDTARAVALRDLCREVLLPDLLQLMARIRKLAKAHADVPQIGRTHGRHAEPISVGYWLAGYLIRLGQRAELISRTAADLRGKFSGAVGARNALALRWGDAAADVEDHVLARLGLRAGEGNASSQIVQPEYLTDFAHAIVSTFSVLAALADDCRHLMRSEIEEIGERSATYRIGSSTMPHKVNPKNFENVKSLWKAFMPRMTTVYLDQLSEHQRDLTNSASSGFFNELPTAFIYAVRRLDGAIEHAEINPTAIARNLTTSAQWTIAEPLYVALALSGHPDAYDLSRELVAKARTAGVGLLTLLRSDADSSAILDQLPSAQRAIVLDPSKYIGDAVSRTNLICELSEVQYTEPLLTFRLKRPEESAALELSNEAPSANGRFA